MEPLVECVPNFSEGSDPAVLDAIATAIETQPAVLLLDRSADRDHGRSVYTMAGERNEVGEAMESAMAVALDRIDMRLHRGVHPRIGAIDVVPFVPLGSTTMADCVADARRFAVAVADRFELPVYLYAHAALKPERRLLSDIRRPGFEGLARTMLADEGAPDFGPHRPHPTGGATAIGARPFLIAFNVQLATADVAVAQRIAARIRHRDGGLAFVQALGFGLASRGCVQVSMNLLDPEATPLWVAWEAVERLAAEGSVDVLDSELVGLAPAAALDAVADHIGIPLALSLEERITQAAAWLRLRDFHAGMAIEVQLARSLAARRAQADLGTTRARSHQPTIRG